MRYAGQRVCCLKIVGPARECVLNALRELTSNFESDIHFFFIRESEVYPDEDTPSMPVHQITVLLNPLILFL